MRTLSLALLLIVLGVASCGKDRGPLKPQPPEIGKEIVFYGSTSDGNNHLFLINADGTGLHQLTTDSLSDWAPRWSPDGSKIVFIRRYSAIRDSENVTVMNADGTGLVRLTYEHPDAYPSWSSDGTRISYQHGPVSPFTADLWVMNADGTAPHLLMGIDSTGGALSLMWTRQDLLLGNDDLGIKLQPTPDATSLRRIIRLDGMSWAYPRMSPDGETVAFSWGGPFGSDGPYIYTVKVDGTEMTQLTHGHDTNPIWSPDGKKIAYIAEDGQIWIMNSDGTNAAQVIDRGFSLNQLGDWK